MSATITCTLCGYHGPKHDVFGQECMRATVERIATLEAAIERLTEERDAAQKALRGAERLAVEFSGEDGKTIVDLRTALATKDDALAGLLAMPALNFTVCDDCEHKNGCAQIRAARTALGATQKEETNG